MTRIRRVLNISAKEAFLHFGSIGPRTMRRECRQILRVSASPPSVRKAWSRMLRLHVLGFAQHRVDVQFRGKREHDTIVSQPHQHELGR